MPPTENATIETTARVEAIRPLFEDGIQHAVDAQFDVTPDRAARLVEMELVSLVDPTIPRPPKLARARQRCAAAEATAMQRTREREAIAGELQNADVALAGLRQTLATADGLDALKTAQRAVTAAELDRDTQHELLKNVTRIAQAAASEAVTARRVQEELERRVGWLKTEGIPQAEAALGGHQAKHAEVLRTAANYQATVRRAEEDLQALQAELAVLGE